jgi:hypothetical protein
MFIGLRFGHKILDEVGDIVASKFHFYKFAYDSINVKRF